MKNLGFGGMALPVGFRCKFDPTDEEIIGFILRKLVVERQPLIPPYDNYIHTCNLFGTKCEPSEIWRMNGGDEVDDVEDEKRLYFLSEVKRLTLKRLDRKIGEGGSWNEKQISKLVEDNENKGIGRKRIFRYVNKKSEDDGRWLLDEYSSFSSPKNQNDNSYDFDFVICRMRNKKGWLRIQNQKPQKRRRISEKDCSFIASPPPLSPTSSNLNHALDMDELIPPEISEQDQVVGSAIAAAPGFFGGAGNGGEAEPCNNPSTSSLENGSNTNSNTNSNFNQSLVDMAAEAAAAPGFVDGNGQAEEEACCSMNQYPCNCNFYENALNLDLDLDFSQPFEFDDAEEVDLEGFLSDTPPPPPPPLPIAVNPPCLVAAAVGGALPFNRF